MERIRRANLSFALAVACLLFVGSPIIVYAYSCTYWSDSKKTYFEGYGYRCAGSGSGCTQCTDADAGSTCVESGFTDCMNPLNKVE